MNNNTNGLLAGIGKVLMVVCLVILSPFIIILKSALKK
jgi:hypothetical protein